MFWGGSARGGTILRRPGSSRSGQSFAHPRSRQSARRFAHLGIGAGSERYYSAIKRLLGSPAKKHHRHGPQENFEIQPERPAIDIFEIEPHPILEIGYFIAS